MNLKPILSKEAQQTLKDIIDNEKNGVYWKYRFSGLSRQEDIKLRGAFKELSDNGMVNVMWADNIPYNIVVLNDGYMYSNYDNPERNKLASMLEEAKGIKSPINATILPGGPNIDTYNAPASDWVNAASTFIERHIKDHPLYQQMHREIFHHKVMAFNSIKSSLNTVLQDDEYWEKDEDIQAEVVTTQKGTESMYDVFLSHANADKQEFVDQLYNSLEKLGIKVFYDKNSISWGDKWKADIIEGTKKARFAIIVVSENFFGREWTEKELNSFMHRENSSGQKIILPIVHNITFSQLQDKYPDLADIQAIDSSQHSVDEIALLFARELIKDLK